MKTNYYVIILDQNNNLCVDSLGECLNEDASLTEANKYGRKNGVSIIWTCTEDKIKQLFDSIKNYEL